ncbi:MAG: hypothetical protein F6K28_60055 [Microcoleus sp. SIO2G3]|nr:hypothetical protein [Microcoleus sp. SIO2G3]
MKTTLKDAQVSLRFNKEILEAMKASAASENISLSDYLAKLYQERNEKDDLKARVEAIERVLFHQSKAA